MASLPARLRKVEETLAAIDDRKGWRLVLLPYGEPFPEDSEKTVVVVDYRHMECPEDVEGVYPPLRSD